MKDKTGWVETGGGLIGEAELQGMGEGISQATGDI